MSVELRVFVRELRQGEITLDEEASRYVLKVHRSKVGTALELFDPSQALVASGILRDVSGRRAVVVASSPSEAPRQTMPVRLLQGIGKGDKPEQAIRDVTAFGVEELVLVDCERSVAKSAGGTRMDRLVRVAEQVARQCERGDMPRIIGPLSFQQAVHRVPEGGQAVHRLLCAFVPSARPLLRELESIRWDCDRVDLMIGPEGGLSAEEIAFALAAGYCPVSLGPYVLRTEVACSFALSVLRAQSHHRQNELKI